MDRPRTLDPLIIGAMSPVLTALERRRPLRREHEPK
jgi:hypothetical protein